ncbi:GntR family transcriptional regulator [Ruegeria sp. HKCCD7318]|uniref:GntR family transcriptional regulator n=1 Tax=Ruegeria sp. HKCCD7318 TaxID=2683014 RepID=UPI0014927AF9|nr:GntR family transcriptional regulator [Ruegeria sp. HKCCD7318]NOE33373.1 FCD domain-containing protein [Ruegeria sp. HKCCD7318]
MHDLSKMQPLKRENLQDIVFSKLCELILEGGLEPGQPVTVATLSEALSVSPMPIREAMARLAHSGALTHLSGRSMGVPKLERQDLRYLRDVRCEIEPAALSWAIDNQTPEFIRSLEDHLTEMVKAEQASDNHGFIHSNYLFHFTIYEQSGNPVALEIIRNLWLRVSPYFHLLNIRGHLQISNEIHFQLLSAIKEGNKSEARSCLSSDINRAYEQMVTCLFPDTRQ